MGKTRFFIHTNPKISGWVDQLKTHTKPNSSVVWVGLGWVQPTSFRRVFLIKIAIYFSKCWKFSFFLYLFKRTFFSFKFFEKNFFFKLRKKKMKKRFFHFSHVITKFFIHNVNKLHKQKNHSKIFFVSQYSAQMSDFITTFFFSIFEAQYFFFHWFFNIFLLFEICRRVRFSL